MIFEEPLPIIWLKKQFLLRFDNHTSHIIYDAVSSTLASKSLRNNASFALDYVNLILFNNFRVLMGLFFKEMTLFRFLHGVLLRWVDSPWSLF